MSVRIARRLVEARHRAEREAKAVPKEPVVLAPPDWNNTHQIYGGAVHEVPRPWVWRWPNSHRVRRTVYVEVSTWRGLSIGASHYYATVKEDENQIWDGREIAWRSNSRSDDAMKTRDFKANVFTREDAVLFARVVLDTFFRDDKLYRIVGMDGGGVGRAEVLRRFSRRG